MTDEDEIKKWDIEPIWHEGQIGMRLNKSDTQYEKTFTDEHQKFIGKIVRLQKTEWDNESTYWDWYGGVPHYCNDHWGYVGNWLFEVIPDSEYNDYTISTPCKLAILIAVLE